MNVLETLHLRMSGDALDDLAELVQIATGAQGNSPSVNVFRHSRVQGDFLVHIDWSGPGQTDRPSELGLRLASLLRIHGLVEHSVWVREGESQKVV
jgi:hypothetical protein